MKIPSTENPTQEMGADLVQGLMAPITGAPNLPTPDEDDPNGWQAAVGDAQTMAPPARSMPGSDNGSSLDMPEPVLVAQAADPLVVLDALTQGAPGDPAREALDDTYRRTLAERDGADALNWLDQQSGGQLFPKEEQPAEGGGLLDTAVSVAKGAGAVASDVFRGATNIPETYVGPSLKAAEANANFLVQSTGLLANWIEKNIGKLPGGVQFIDPKTGKLDLKLLSETDWSQFQAAGGQMPNITIPGATNPNDASTTTGAIVGNIVQFLAGLYLTGTYTGGVSTAGGGKEIGKRIGQYFLTDLTAFDAQQGNLANLLQAVPALQNPIAEYLATDQNTPEIEGRIKNAMVGLGLNAVTEGVIYGLRVIKAARRARELGAGQGAAPMAGAPGSPSGPSATPQNQAIANRVNQILGDPSQPMVNRIDRKLKPMETGVPDHYAGQALSKTATSGQYGDVPRTAKPPADVPMPVVGETLATDIDLVDIPKGTTGKIVSIDDAAAKAGMPGDIRYDIEFTVDGKTQKRTLPATAVRDMVRRSRGYETPVPPTSEAWRYYAPGVEADGRMRITTPDGSMSIKARPQIMELDELTHATGDLQVRQDRYTSPEYIAQAKDRAVRHDISQVMPSTLSDSGAPIVFMWKGKPTIISGNGRAMTFQELFTNPALTRQRDEYLAALGPKAKGMKKPVLVMFSDDIPDPARFGDLSNGPRIAAMSAAEKGQRDAARLGLENMALYKGGDFEKAENADFLSAFSKYVVTEAERSEFIKNTKLTSDGVKRLNAAVLSAAYDDAPLLARMVESTDETIKNLTGAMLDAAPHVAQLKADIASGIGRPDMDITPWLSKAVMQLDDITKRGLTLKRWTDQIDAFDNTPEPVKEMMRGFYKDDLSSQATRKIMREFLVEYATEARKHAYGGLIPDETNVADVLNAARRKAFGQKPGEGVQVFRADAFGDGTRYANGGAAVREPGLPGSGGQPAQAAGAAGQALDAIDQYAPGGLSPDAFRAAAKKGKDETVTRVLHDYLVANDAAYSEAVSKGGKMPAPSDKVIDAAYGNFRRQAFKKANYNAPNFGLPPPRYVLPEGDDLLRETHLIDPTPERLALRQELIDTPFKGKTPVKDGETPVAYIMGGGGASGKSTVVTKLKKEGRLTHNFVDLNPDEFKDPLPEYKTLVDLGDARAAKVVHEESSKLCNTALQKGVTGRYNLLIDKTLGNPAKNGQLLKDLKAAGYDVRLVGVTIDPDEAILRADERGRGTPFKKGSGRIVDAPDLLTAHKGFSQGFEDYADLADSAELYDNNGLELKLLAEKNPAGDLVIHDDIGYNQFAQKGAINEKSDTFAELTGARGGAPAFEVADSGRMADLGPADAGRGAGSLEETLGQPQAAPGDLAGQRLTGPNGPTQPPGSPPGGPGGFGASGPGPRQPFSGEHYINWNRINTLDDVKAVIGQMADASADDIRKAQRGVISNAETIKAAGDENAWKLLLGQRKGSIPLAHEQLALRQMWASSGQKLLQTAQMAASGGEAEAVAFRKMLALHNTIQQHVMGVRTETARALQQWVIGAGPDEQMLKQMQGMLSQAGGLNTTKELAVSLASLASDPMRFEKMVQKSVWARTGAAVREAWINALLSNPPTHIANAASNTTVFFNSLAERAAAGQIGSALDPVSGVRAGEATYMLLGAKEAMKDALSAFWRSLSTGESTYAKAMGLRSPMDQGFVPAISAEAFNVKGNFMAKGIDMLGTMVRFPGRAMQASDEFFKIINGRAETWALSFRQASQEIDRGLLDPAKFKLRVAELIDNPTQAMKLQAADMAAYNTFTAEPGDLVRSLLKVRDKAGPIGTVVAPFVNTPANILKYTFDRTPLAPLSSRFRADMAAGGARRNLALARLGIGSMLIGTAYDLALDGHITGNGPGGENEGRERATLGRSGWQRYSIRTLTGEREDGSPIYRYFAYNRLDPIGMYIGIAADMAEVAANMDIENPDVMKTFQQIAVASAMAAADNFMEKTYTSGFASIMDAVMHPDRYSDRWFMRLAGSVVPAGVAGITRMTDPYAKYTVDMLDQLKARTPGLSKDVPNKLNIWADPIAYQSGLGGFYDAVSPVYSKSTENAEPIDREFFKLDYHPSDTVAIPLKGTNDDRTVRLPMRNRPDVTNRFKTVMAKTPAASLVEDNIEGMMARRGSYKAAISTLSQLGDRDMKTALNDLVTGKLDSLSLDYEAADVDEKRSIIQGIMQAYRMATTVQITREFPDLQELRDQIAPRTMRAQEAPF